jgi:hypothetical protein
MPRRNKAVVLLFMPIAVLIWFVGWAMVCFGSKRETFKPRVQKQPELTFGVLPLEREHLPEICA